MTDDDTRKQAEASLDAQLKAMFQDAAVQPLPASLLDLVDDLEAEAEAPQSATKAAAAG